MAYWIKGVGCVVCVFASCVWRCLILAEMGMKVKGMGRMERSRR
jgi:hypothetical protein